jgi:hypothetical protein
MTKFGSFLKEAASVALDVIEDQQKKKSSTHNNEQNDTTSPSSKQRAAAEDEVSQLDDGSHIPLSDCTGNKKSLFVGINYFGSKAELRGCINDVHNIKEFVVTHFKFPTDSTHMRVLTDDKNNDPSLVPTKQNMIQSFQWLVEGAKSGDSLFFHYSGHGGAQKDTDDDEVDNQDETLIPVDYEKSGVIVDDDLHRMLVASLPEGVRLTAIMDCCHSGSVFDLPFTYGVDGNLEVYETDNRKAAVEAAISAGMSFIKGDKAGALVSGVRALSLYMTPSGEANEEAKKRQIEIRSTVADVIQFSGCRDEQTSADANIGGEATGAMSWSFIQAFEQHGFNQNYLELLGNVRKLLHGKYTQIPQMSTGHRMDMKTTFKM